MPLPALRRILLAVALSVPPGGLALAEPPAPPPPPPSAPAAPAPAPEAAELARGKDQLLQKNYPEAVKAFRQADKLAHGNCVECQLGLARTFNRLHASKDAEKSALEALRLAAGSPELTSYAMSEQAFAVFSGAKNDADLERAGQLYRKVFEQSGGKSQNAARFNWASILLRLHRDGEGVPLLEEYLKQEPDGAFAESARALLQNPERARKQLIPDFSLVTLDGRFMTAEELKGKVVLLDFWGTWCAPCRAALPSLRYLVRRFDKDPFVLLSVSSDDKDDVLKAFVAKNEMSWPQVWDEDGSFSHKCGINHYPTYWVVNPEGEIVFVRSGWGDGSERELSREIDSALRNARKAKKS